jgi:multisubunit Na+/H+ antiporter MnhC subunit
MEALLALLFGTLFGAAIYLMLARSLPRVLLGLVLLGNAAIVAILAGGRVIGTAPPLVASGETLLAAGAANPLPQALALTAIVIAFGLGAFVMVLVWAVWRETRTLDAEELRLAEPPGLPAAGAAAAAAAEPPEARP